MATYEQVTYNSPDGALICRTSADKVAFYGAVPVAQRAYDSALHASANLASSTDFAAAQLAVVNEIQATFVALGWWATA